MKNIKSVKIADQILLMMVKEHKNSGKESYHFNEFTSLLPGIEQRQLINAIHLLKEDGFVKILHADDIPYLTFLLIDAIRQVEEDTLLRKGYLLVKEVCSLIP